MNRGSIGLGMLGIYLICKGLSGNVMQTKMGDNLFPQWLYVVAGMVLLVFPTMSLLVRSRAGQAWMGL